MAISISAPIFWHPRGVTAPFKFGIYAYNIFDLYPLRRFKPDVRSPIIISSKVLQLTQFGHQWYVIYSSFILNDQKTLILFGNILQKLSQCFLSVIFLRVNKRTVRISEGVLPESNSRKHAKGDLVKFKRPNLFPIQSIAACERRTMPSPIVDKCLGLPPKRLNP